MTIKEYQEFLKNSNNFTFLGISPKNRNSIFYDAFLNHYHTVVSIDLAYPYARGSITKKSGNVVFVNFKQGE